MQKFFPNGFDWVCMGKIKESSTNLAIIKFQKTQNSVDWMHFGQPNVTRHFHNIYMALAIKNFIAQINRLKRDLVNRIIGSQKHGPWIMQKPQFG